MKFAQPSKTSKYYEHDCRMMTINFQIIWGKKEDLALLLLKNNIDIAIGRETSCIHDSEFLPVNYSSFCRDTKDGSDGVIVIMKK